MVDAMGGKTMNLSKDNTKQDTTQVHPDTIYVVSSVLYPSALFSTATTTNWRERKNKTHESEQKNVYQQLQEKKKKMREKKTCELKESLKGLCGWSLLF